MNGLMIALALIAGMSLPLQAAINSRLGATSPSAWWAALVNFIVGGIALGVIAQAAPVKPGMTLSGMGQAPWWAWLGGLVGAAFVASAIRTTPVLGTSIMLCCAIAGQLAASLALDHFGWFGLDARPVSVGKLVGVGLVFIGALIVLRSR